MRRDKLTAMALIRPAVIEDAPAIARLTRQLGYSVEESATRELLAALIAAEERDVLVFCEEGVLAWVGLSVHHGLTSDPFAELMGLVVDEDHRSKGIGAKLMEAAQGWAKAQGCTKLRLRTNMVRADAHRFYERLGYTAIKEQRIYEKPLS